VNVRSRRSLLLRKVTSALLFGLLAAAVGTGSQPTMQRPGGTPSPLSIQQRFTVQGDGTVRDNSTGLIWLRNANEFGPMTQQEAEAAVAVLADGRHGLSDGSQPGDWRLPTTTQWSTLLDCRWSSPPLADTSGAGQWTDWDPFFGVQHGSVGAWYWSSSLCLTTDGLYYAVSMLSCASTKCSTNDPEYHVWPVRLDDSPGPDGGRFTVRGNGTVLDTASGLVWMRNADRFGLVTKEEARVLVRAIGHGTYGLTDHSQPGDWRIPTSTEWGTLLDCEWSTPPLWNTMGTAKWSEGDPFCSVQCGSHNPYYWSRSVCHESGLWWAQDMLSCAVRKCSAVADVQYYLWPVRDAR